MSDKKWIDPEEVTLRDKLALRAPTINVPLGREFKMPTLDEVCRYRYEWADAMMRARSKGEGGGKDA